MVPSILRWRTQRRWQAGERVQRYRRRLTAQQRDKRQQDNRRQLVGQHLSDSLCSLTGEQDRQRTATGLSQLRFVISSTSDQIFHVLSVRHMMCMMLMCYTPIMYDALKPNVLWYVAMYSRLWNIPWRDFEVLFLLYLLQREPSRSLQVQGVLSKSLPRLEEEIWNGWSGVHGK